MYHAFFVFMYTNVEQRTTSTIDFSKQATLRIPVITFSTFYIGLLVQRKNSKLLEDTLQIVVPILYWKERLKKIIRLASPYIGCDS